MAVSILEARTNHSKQMLERIRTEIDSIEELKSEPNLSIYVTGSYGRLEASATSDLDPFFVYDDSEGTSSLSKISEILISARLIKICRTLELPEFSNEGQYLEVHSLNSMLKYLGGPEDDYRNYFTARLLLLLESQPLCNEEAYLKIIERIIEEYFRDYSTHERDFRPIFLANDILRYWKTLCLNYEERRNLQVDDPAKKTKPESTDRGRVATGRVGKEVLL